MSEHRLVRVLSIDGGGIRGLIPALVLAEIERRAARPAAELFDLVAGTSTGGIIGIGVCKGMTADELAAFYPTFGHRIFGGSEASGLRKRLLGSQDTFWKNMRAPADKLGSIFGRDERWGGNARHAPAGLESVLKEVLGDTRLSDVRTELVVTSFDGLSSTPVVFSSRRAKTFANEDLSLVDVARATSAAPTFFPPHEIRWAGADRQFVDGGVWANNPAGVALIESLHATAGKGLTGDSVYLVSLGTGAGEPAGSFSGTRSWLNTANDMIATATSTTAGDVLARLALPSGQYVRLQVVDSQVAGAMDDPSAVRLQALEVAAKTLIDVCSAQIDAIVSNVGW